MNKCISICIFLYLVGSNCFANIDDYTFGWELEFAAGNEVRRNKVVSFENRKQTKYNFEQLSKPIVNTQDYPFLRPYGSIEQSGNIEIHSTVTRGDLDKVIWQMHETIEGIHAENIGLNRSEWRKKGSKVASVHLHFRFDRSKILPLSHQEFTAWVSRLTDLVVGWRFSHTSFFSALKKRTQVRNPPHYTSLRGAVRLSTDDMIENDAYKGEGKQYDIEIRGHLCDIHAIKKTVELIIAGIENPSSINGFYDHQALFFKQTKPLSTHVSEFMILQGKFLTNREKDLIDQLAKSSVYSNWWGEKRYYTSNERSLLPTMGLEYAPYFTKDQRESIKNANNEFYRQVYEFVKRPNLDLSFIGHREYVYKKHQELDAFRKLIYQWTNTINMWEIFKESLYVSEIQDADHLHQDPQYYIWLMEHITYAESSVLNILRTIDESMVKKVYLTHNFNPAQKARLVEAFRNAGKSELYFYAQKIVHLNAKNRKNLAKSLENSSSQPNTSAEDIYFYHDHEADFLDLHLGTDKYSLCISIENFVGKYMKIQGWHKDQTMDTIISRFRAIGVSNGLEAYQALPEINHRIEIYNAHHKRTHKLFTQYDLKCLAQAYRECILDLIQN